tara:strand:- start:32 stop:274 length:243 start_codon:yes stop_codon:yes gene_type:complete
MSLIKSYILSIEEMGFDPYHLNKLSSEEWDNLLTKALKSDKKLYETLILTRCKLSLKFTDCDLTETDEPFTNFNEVEEPF